MPGRRRREPAVGLSPTGRRDLTLLTIGLAASTTGDSAALIALLLRLRPDGSGWVAALLAAELIPIVVLAPVAGPVVDRIETHRVLVAGLVGQAVLAIPLALVGRPWATVLLFAGLNAFTVFVRPATSALVPVITGEDHAPDGYSRLATGSSLGWIIGPVLGGVMAGTLGVSAALLIDAASFALLAAAAASIRARRPPAITATPSERSRFSLGGFELVWRSPVLRVAVTVSAVATGCAVVDNVAAPFRFINQLGTNSAGYGAYDTLWGIGALIGVQILPRLPAARTEAALASGNLFIGLGIAGIGLAQNLAVAYGAAVVGGVGNGLSNVAQSALVSANTPPDKRGRAFAATGAIIQTAIGAGTAAGAPLVSLLHADRAMLYCGAVAAVVAAAGVIIAASRRRLPA